MSDSEKAVKSAIVWLDDDEFAKLVQRFCPELKLVRGPFGGGNWGDSWLTSRTQFGIYPLVIQRMLQEIERTTPSGGKG